MVTTRPPTPGRAFARGAFVAFTLLTGLSQPTVARAHPPSSAQQQRLREFLREHPADVGAHLEHSALLQQAGHAAQALLELERALALRPDDDGLQVARAQVLIELGRPLEAARSLERVSDQGRDAHYHLIAARAARHGSDASAAHAHYEQSLRRARALAVSLEYGAFLEDSGQLSAASRVYAEQLRVSHDAVLLHLALVRALRALGQHEQALTHVERLLAKAQLPTQYRLLRAELLEALSRHEAARRERTQALSEAEAAYGRRPSAQRLALRGRARCANDRSASGLADLRKAATIAPGSLLIQQWLGEATAQFGGTR